MLGAPTFWRVFDIHLSWKPNFLTSFWFTMSQRVKQLPIRLILVDGPDALHELIIPTLACLLTTAGSVDEVYIFLDRQYSTYPVTSYLELFTQPLEYVHVGASKRPLEPMEEDMSGREERELWYDGHYLHVDIDKIVEHLPLTGRLGLDGIIIEAKGGRQPSRGWAGLEHLTLWVPSPCSIRLWGMLRDCNRLKYLDMAGPLMIRDTALPEDKVLETITKLAVHTVINLCPFSRTYPTFIRLQELTVVGSWLLDQFLETNSTITRLDIVQPMTSLDSLSHTLPQLTHLRLCDIELSGLYTTSLDAQWPFEKLEDISIHIDDKPLDLDDVEHIIQHRMLRSQLPNSVATLRKLELRFEPKAVNVVKSRQWQTSRLLTCAELGLDEDGLDQYTWSERYVARATFSAAC